ncbi:MAG: precorrin-6y C5,15-methyltransferase (decarboxylating) subunit CbiE [Clostridiaceae bacterium]|nr:precorrin-6y C5,15-methyltransferase (decarboxylating) subunit CbiE [Clostridiaceae bacterium]
MNKIMVIGIGPGHRDYILPIAFKKIEASDVLIGGRRNLEIFKDFEGETQVITKELDKILHYIKSNRKDKKIAIIVSGDTGFYSMLTYFKKHFSSEEIEVIPGISSLQYLFSRIKEPWQEAPLLSLHGRRENFVEKLKQYKKVGLLTDTIHTPENIGKILMEEGLDHATMVVGENLSYSEERIIVGEPKEIIKNGPYQMTVVVIFHEE